MTMPGKSLERDELGGVAENEGVAGLSSMKNRYLKKNMQSFGQVRNGKLGLNQSLSKEVQAKKNEGLH